MPEDTTAPPKPQQARSPMALAMTRFWRQPSGKIGVSVVALFFFLATYAPLIGNATALIWWDANGVAFPALGELLNQNVYGKLHHLMFNLLAVLLPFILLGWWLTGRYLAWSTGRRLALSLGLWVVAIIGCMIPFIPHATDDGTQWRGLWSPQPQTAATWDAWQDLDEEARGFAVFAPVVHDYDGSYGEFIRPFEASPYSSQTLFLGSDDRGNDVFVRALFGARVSLTIGLISVGLSMVIGIIVGGVSGYFGGWVDLVLQRVVELMMTFPSFILVLVVVAMVGPDIYVIMVVFGLTGWAGTARLVRGEFLAQSGREYVLAGEALGLPRWRIMFRHILPNALTPLLISASFAIAGTILGEGGLAFIGLGDASVPSWGVLLEVGRQNLRYAYLIWVPGLCIFALVMSLNLIGNALREALDPRSASR